MKLLRPLTYSAVLAVWLTGFYLRGAEIAPADQTLVFIGTYTGKKSQGIYLSRLDNSNGKLTSPELAAATKSPSFLAVHPNHHFLYGVGEASNLGGKGGAVSAFSLDAKTGKLALLNQEPSGGGGPCHLAVDPSGKCVLAANYGAGSIVALPILADGKLGPPAIVVQHHGSSINTKRQEGPHAHFINTDPEGRFVLACDLGLDKVLVYRLDSSKAMLSTNDPPFASVKAGSGPRHFVFHPNGHFVYVVNEMGCSITAFRYDSKRGVLTEFQSISTLPEGWTGDNTCAEIQIHPSGRFVYASNRGHDSIAVYTVDSDTGKLTLVEHQPTKGKTPRHFALDPTGRWLLAENQMSDSVVVFKTDNVSGKLTPTGQSIEVGQPVCVVFVGAP